MFTQEIKITTKCPVCKSNIEARHGVAHIGPLVMGGRTPSREYMDVYCSNPECGILFGPSSNAIKEAWSTYNKIEQEKMYVKQEKRQEEIRKKMKPFLDEIRRCRMCGAVDENKCNCVGYEG